MAIEIQQGQLIIQQGEMVIKPERNQPPAVPLGASVDTTSYAEIVANGTNVATVSGPVATATGGSSIYLYSWVYLSGSTDISIVGAGTRTPTFTSTGTDVTNEAVYRLTVSDNVTLETIDIDVTVIINNGTIPMLHHLTADFPGASLELDQGTAGGSWNVNDAVVQRLAGPDGDYFTTSSSQAQPIRKSPSDGVGTYTVNYWMRMVGTTAVTPAGDGVAQWLGIHCDWQWRGTFFRLQADAVGRARNFIQMGNFATFTTTGVGTTDLFIDDDWHWVGYTYNSTTGDAKLYEDGVLVDQRSFTGYVPDQAPADIQILGRNRAQESPSNLDLDEFRFTNRDLSEAEMLIEYTRRKDSFQP